MRRGGRPGESSAMAVPSSGVGAQRAQQARMIDVAGSLGEDDGVARIVAVLHADAREQIRHLVILRLRPLFQRMIVAARAGEALAQKRLRGVFGDLDRVLVQDEVIQRAVLPRAAGAGEDLAGEFVPRLVLFDAVANPVVEGPHRVRTKLAARDQQQIGPFVGPVVDELVALEKLVDQLRALVRRLVGQEVLDFFGGGQNAGGIQIRAADESRRRPQTGEGAMFRLLQLGEHEVVDVSCCAGTSCRRPAST